MPHGKIRPAEGDFAGVYREQKLVGSPARRKVSEFPLFFEVLYVRGKKRLAWHIRC